MDDSHICNVAIIGTDWPWIFKSPCDWTPDDVCYWMFETVAVEQGFRGCECWDVRHLCGENWKGVNGRTLCSMSVEEFVQRDARHGNLLHECLHQQSGDEPYYVRLNEGRLSPDGASIDELFHPLTSHHNCKCRLPGIENVLPLSPITNNIWSSRCTNLPEQINDDSSTFFNLFDDIDGELDNTLNEDMETSPANSLTCDLSSSQPAHRYRLASEESTPTDSASSCDDSVNDMDDNGIRPKVIKDRKTKVNAIHLWQFMLALLADSRWNPDLIKWLDQSDGVFLVVRSAEIARLWGIKKKNRKMTFEKMSRSLRWCRDNRFLADVPKNRGYPKKLCFRFGDRAKNWNGLSSTPISEIIGVSGVPLE